MRKYFIWIPVFGTLFAGGSASADDHSITARGTAALSAPPDSATVMLGVVASSATVADALHDNNDRMTRVIAGIRALGIKDSEIRTWNFSVQPKHPQNQYGYDLDETTGYIISNKIQVSVSDMAKVAKVVDAAFAAGANFLDSVNFVIKDDSAFRDRVLSEAVKDAHHRAAIMAASEGAELGHMLSVSNIERSYVGTGDLQSVPMAITVQNINTPILPGSISLSAQVVVTYAIK